MLGKVNLGAKVEDRDGTNVATVKYLVADPKSDNITHLVIEKGLFSSRLLVVESATVGNVTGDGKVIRLRLSVEQIDRLPDFIERDYSASDFTPHRTSSNRTETGEATASDNLPGFGPSVDDFVYTGQPGSSGFITGMSMSGQGSLYGEPAGAFGMPYSEKMNIPDNSMLIKQGTPVEALDGRVGKVKEVNIDSVNGKLVSIVVHQGLFFTSEMILPLSVVDSVTEGSVLLNINKEETKHLHDNLSQEPKSSNGDIIDPGQSDQSDTAGRM